MNWYCIYWDNFRDAILRPVVDGKITKVRIIDEGTGYTKPPTIKSILF